MMSSSYPTSYPQIDHRSLFKSPAQLETTNCCPTISPSGSTSSSKETLIADIFSPITDFPHTAELAKAKGTIPTTTKVDAPFANLPSTPLNASCATTSRRRPSSSLASLSGTKTKIPYPLTTIWSNRNTFHFRGKVCGNCCNVSVAVGGGGGVGRGGSLRMRGTKSNLPPLIMEPVANETALPSTARVDCTHDSTTTPNVGQTGGSRFYTARRKLALITQKPSADPQLERSLSLRKNFKYSPKTDSPLEKPSKSATVEEASCAAAGTAPNITVLSAGHDDVQQSVTKDSYKDQGGGSSSAAATTKIMENQTISTDPTMVNGKLSRECRKMSLNQNGLHTSSAAATTPTTTTTAATTPHYQHQQQQHTRPLTLATSAAASTPITSGGNGVGAGGSIKTPKSPRPATGNGSHIPQPQQHHLLSPQESQPTHSNNKALGTGQGGVGGIKLTPKTPPVTPDSPSTYLDDDLDSLYSYTTTSGRSTMSCEHPYVARNGTTFSGRKMKYVVHCSNYAGQVGADYLTPTQRAQRQIRRLKELLCVARQDLEQKDSELLRLTREVVELRLFKASLSSPDERSASSDAVTVREAELKTSQDVSPIVDMVDDAQKQHSGSPTRHMHGGHPHHHHVGHATSASPTVMIHPSQNSHHHHNHHHDMQSSFADSGHFEDLTSSSVHSKDSSYAPSSHGHHERACSAGVSSGGILHDEASTSTLEQYELQRQELIRLYEQRIEDLVRSQDAVATDIKRSNNDRIEALLQKLAECNTRYADIVPDYEHAKERIRELEKQLEDLQRKLAEHEEKQKQMYLHMYQKGQEAERIARADQALELAHRAPQNKVSINELLHQLQSTQDELENIRAAECRNECGSNHALLTAKEAISLWVLGARKTIYRRLLEAQKNRTHVDPEVTLQFLKSAVYYFLTDKENSQGHLQAIESILEFSEAEKQVINKARASK